ncbi:hypothetical protein M758_8G171200 [Ceratodon purpureus]|uniref:Uncharacterized protein n=1 Tax=Ceratodon purpureus TaxID=3225 RepID=A0A8T0H4B8_CERPU|nr:hypothetical protein KC19_8G176600 [Ceratodon purpureus]KAG0609264.1 hypothetical protein M758_8G171200 [Ceratodon purpureus]
MLISFNHVFVLSLLGPSLNSHWNDHNSCSIEEPNCNSRSKSIMIRDGKLASRI